MIYLEIQSSLNGESVEAILNVAGGWAGGNAGDKNFIKDSDLMIKQSVYSSLISASLANKFLKENGLLTLAGAAAALDTTPGSIRKSENYLP
jgi:dihydropteridine reductase